MFRERLLICVTVLFAHFSVCRAEEPEKAVILPFRDVFFTTGACSYEGRGTVADIAFQLSLRTPSLRLGKGWEGFIGYTQLTIWNFYDKSSPFHDNSYMPGLYVTSPIHPWGALSFGLEHDSNGRPYYGNPLSDENRDDYSRGMNWAFADWWLSKGSHTVRVSTRFGVGNGVGSYARTERLYTQDLFLRYMGYLTVSYRYYGEHVKAHAALTPVFNIGRVNITADVSFPIKGISIEPFVRFHFGYDDALCDCVEGFRPPLSLRAGAVLRTPVAYNR